MPEEERSLGAALALDENGKPVDTKTFVQDLRSVRKEMSELDGKSRKEKIDILANIMTTLNGSQTSPERIAAAYKTLEDEFGGNAIAAMDSITLTTTIQSLVDAEQMLEDAKALDAAANKLDPATQREGITALRNQASNLRSAAGELQDSAFSGAASSVLNPAPTSGGGGGGGGDSETNWIEDTIKTKEDNKDYLKRLNKVKEQNLKLAKDGVKLSEEIMEAIAKDEDAYDDYMNGKYSNRKIRNAYYKNLAFEEKEQNKQMKRQKRQEKAVKDYGIADYFVEQQILNDPELLALFEEKPGQALKIAEERAAVETTLLDRMQHQYDIQRQKLDLQEQELDLAIQRAEYEAENKFFEDSGTGKDRAQIAQENAEAEAAIKVIQGTQIKPIKDKIEEQKHYIKLLEKEFEVNQDNIKALQKEVKAKQRSVEDMQRALELRQREGEMLSHDLKLMDYIVEDINKSYDDRIAKLDEIASLNQQIAQSQQDQLGLADALSKGDIGAAAQAMQQMQQNQMQFASQQYRSQLETSKQSSIDSLTGAESGLTREQIEDRNRVLEEDAYQTGLQIRAVEDEIYNLNRQIRDEQDIIDSYKESIEKHTKNIRDFEWQIYEIEQNAIKPIQAKVDANNVLLSQADLAVTKAGADDKIAAARFKRQNAMWDAEYQFALARQSWEESHGERLLNNLKIMKKSTRQANEFHKALAKGNGKILEMPSLAEVQAIGAYESSDLTKLTQDLDKAYSNYEAGGVVSNMSPASYSVPASAVGSGAVNGIMGTVTNNFNTNNVNVSSVTPSSADDIANLVMQKINFAQMGNVR